MDTQINNNNEDDLDIITPDVMPVETVDNAPSIETEALVVSASMIAQANRLHQEVTSLEEEIANAGMRSMLATLRLGSLLCQLKEATPHGEFALLFNDSQLRLKGDSSNVPCVGHLNFAKSTGQRYMSTYRKAVAEYTSQREDQTPLLNYLHSSDDANLSKVKDIDDVLKIATKGAETPRQMMLNLDVIKAPAPSPRRETILENRNTKGGPKKDRTISPEQTLAFEKKIATEAFARICDELNRFYQSRRLPLLEEGARIAGISLLDEVIHILKSVNKN